MHSVNRQRVQSGYNVSSLSYGHQCCYEAVSLLRLKAGILMPTMAQLFFMTFAEVLIAVHGVVHRWLPFPTIPK